VAEALVAPPWRRILGRTGVWVPLAAIATSLLVCFLAIALSGKDAAGGYLKMAQGALGGVGPLGETAFKAGVLTCTGLSVGLALVVGLFNIGAEGQFIAGALAAAALGRALQLPAPLHLPVCILGAAVAGALPALLAAWLKVRRGVHEVISTIMLNWAVIHLVQGWLVPGPLRARSASADISSSGTEEIWASAHLPRLLEGSRLDLGAPLAAVLALAIWMGLRRSVLGYELRAIGSNAEAARCAAIPVGRRIALAMGLAGALAGIGGALLILGTEHRFPGVFRTGYGFDGIAVALVGGGHTLGILGAAAFFGAVRAGATRLQLVGIHPSFTELIQGLAVLLVAGREAFRAFPGWAARLLRARRRSPS
jgi:simple sugar transport system permease protein